MRFTSALAILLLFGCASAPREAPPGPLTPTSASVAGIPTWFDEVTAVGARDPQLQRDSIRAVSRERVSELSWMEGEWTEHYRLFATPRAPEYRRESPALIVPTRGKLDRDSRYGPQSDPGRIYFLGNKYQVDGEFSAPGYNLNEFITANVTDSFSVQLELTTSPGGYPIVNTSAFQNGPSNYSGAACPDPDVTTFELSGTFEVITADSSNAGYANKILSLGLSGVSAEPGVTLHFGPTITQTIPGGTSSTSVFIEAPVAWKTSRKR